MVVQTEPLIFIKELKDIKYQLNDRLVFLVRMNKRSSDNSRCLHNGQSIEPSNRIEIVKEFFIKKR